MTEQGKALRESAPIEQVGLAPPRLEQLLFACAGYVLGQLLALIVFSDPGDEEFLIFGITGAVLGVIAHVLVRGVGMKVPVIGKRFRVRVPNIAKRISGNSKGSADSPKRASRYRAALSAFRRPFKRRKRKSEAPGNEEKIIKTDNGYRVGDREFSRRSEAEDYLYLGDPTAGDGAKDGASKTPAPRPVRRFNAAPRKALKPLALAAAVAIVVMVLLLS